MIDKLKFVDQCSQNPQMQGRMCCFGQDYLHVRAWLNDFNLRNNWKKEEI